MSDKVVTNKIGALRLFITPTAKLLSTRSPYLIMTKISFIRRKVTKFVLGFTQTTTSLSNKEV